MIPDANLPEWVICYAEYEGQAVRLVDYHILRQTCICPDESGFGRFTVGCGTFELYIHPAGCPMGGTPSLPCVYETDDEAEARAVYAEEAERLRHVDS